MYEEKLREKIEYDRGAIDDMFVKLASMVGNVDATKYPDESLFALLAVLKYLDVNTDNISARDFNKSNIGSIFHDLGLISRPVTLHGKWWRDATGPFLATDKDGKFVALVPRFLSYKRLDFSTGKKIPVNAKTTSDLTGTALCLLKELPRRKLGLKDLLRYTVRTIKLRNILLINVICILVVFLGSLVPFANKFIFNEVVPAGDINGIFPICSFLLGIGICSALFELYRNMALTRSKDKWSAYLQPVIMARVFSLPNSFFKEYSAGDISARSLSVNNIYQLISSEILVTVAVGLFSSMYIFVVYSFAKELVLLLTLILVVYIIFSIAVYKAFTKRNSKVLPYKAKTQGFVYSLISGIHKIRNNGAESRAMQQWAERFSKSELLSAESSTLVKYRRTLSVFVFKLCLFAVYYFAWKSRMSISDYIAFNAAFGVMLGAFDELQMVMIDISQIIPQLKMVEPILETVPDSSEDSVIVDNISGSIELSNVMFGYGTSGQHIVLKNINLKIRAGENVGIVGRSGCGKSTLMRLMMGFEVPSSGSIFYDQYDLGNTNLNSLHHFTGYCPQELHIFPDTIKNNIKISKPEATDEEIWEAARIACIDEDIRRMPMQMETMLGEGGTGLSGGQGQRVMIARAVLNRPRIIFFDEATSALDNLTQKQVVKNLEEIRCTRISIAHRLSTIEHCDRIIVLDNGEIIEDGTPDELIKQQGLFYRLAKRQQL